MPLPFAPCVPVPVPVHAPTGSLSDIAGALGVAAVKAVLCIGTILAGGRLIVAPLYRKIASFGQAEIFAATTLLMVLGTSVLTQVRLALHGFVSKIVFDPSDPFRPFSDPSDPLTHRTLMSFVFEIAVFELQYLTCII